MIVKLRKEQNSKILKTITNFSKILFNFAIIVSPEPENDFKDENAFLFQKFEKHFIKKLIKLELKH